VGAPQEAFPLPRVVGVELLLRRIHAHLDVFWVTMSTWEVCCGGLPTPGIEDYGHHPLLALSIPVIKAQRSVDRTIADVPVVVVEPA
jgi:hypothetical protein